jgi:hypothetical protein
MLLYTLIHFVNDTCLIFAGNAGGYLGLFLGYALLNVPELIMDLWDWMKGIGRRYNHQMYLY